MIKWTECCRNKIWRENTQSWKIRFLQNLDRGAGNFLGNVDPCHPCPPTLSMMQNPFLIILTEQDTLPLSSLVRYSCSLGLVTRWDCHLFRVGTILSSCVWIVPSTTDLSLAATIIYELNNNELTHTSPLFAPIEPNTLGYWVPIAGAEP